MRPLPFLLQYCPEQFEILGITKTWCGQASKIYGRQEQVSADGAVKSVTKLNDGAVLSQDRVRDRGKTYCCHDGREYVQVYPRVLKIFSKTCSDMSEILLHFQNDYSIIF